jgi:biotin operon repressor
MKTDEAIKEFGSMNQLAKALGITRQAVHRWGEDVPELRRYQINELKQGRGLCGKAGEATQ